MFNHILSSYLSYLHTPNKPLKLSVLEGVADIQPLPPVNSSYVIIRQSYNFDLHKT